MLTEQHIQEGLSRAYVSAVVANAGLNISLHLHDYGVDCTIHEIRIIHGKRQCSGISLDVQLKASRLCTFDSSEVIYDLEAAAYNSMVVRHSESTFADTPIVLVVLALPEEDSEWLSVSETELILRHCCYWILLEGQPTKHKRSIRIRVPRTNLFDSENLKDLFSKAKLGKLRGLGQVKVNGN
jgi:hypothetical protein